MTSKSECSSSKTMSKRIKHESDAIKDVSPIRKRIKQENVESMETEDKETNVEKDDDNEKDNNSKNVADTKKESYENSNNAPRVLGLANNERLLFENMPRWLETNADNKDCFRDTAIITRDQRCFLVHANVVSAGSQRFRGILGNLAKETTFKIELEDLSGDELVWMLNYIYEGQVELLDESQEKRMEQLIKQYGLLRSPVSVRLHADAKDDSLLEQLRKGGLMRVGKGAKCLDCGKSFSQYANAKGHYEVKHTLPSDPSKFTCPLCGKKNSHQLYLEHHLRTKHGIKKSELKGHKL